MLETSIINLNKDSGDLNRTIQSVIKYLVPMKKYASLTFKNELNNLPLCNYDSEQIQHLLVQLFTNTADVKKNATILIKSYSRDDKNYVEVEDDGPGFPPGMSSDFVVADGTNNGGYGLVLCKSIIERHNGDIKILPTQKGAAVQFMLPVE